MYRVSEEEYQEQQREYKKKYPPFEPFVLSKEGREKISFAFQNVITTQNGVDTDDYSIMDHNDKPRRYLSSFPSGAKTLILGTGTGREVLSAKSMGLDAVGTTLGSRNTYFGHNYLGLSSSELVECLNEDLPFPKETFDVVAGFQIFEHTMAPLLFLLEQSRVLKMGGKLILEWPPANQFTMEDNPHHQVCFTPGQAEGLFQKAGFGSIKLYYEDFSPIEEKDWWRGDQEKMLCIEGKKVNTSKDYVRRAWEL